LKRWQWGGKRWDVAAALAIRHQWRSRRWRPRFKDLHLEQRADGHFYLVVRGW
jgi:hypothetical protein